MNHFVVDCMYVSSLLILFFNLTSLFFFYSSNPLPLSSSSSTPLPFTPLLPTPFWIWCVCVGVCFCVCGVGFGLSAVDLCSIGLVTFADLAAKRVPPHRRDLRPTPEETTAV